MARPKRYSVEGMEGQDLTFLALPVNRSGAAIVQASVTDADVVVYNADGTVRYTAVDQAPATTTGSPALAIVLTGVVNDAEWPLSGAGYSFAWTLTDTLVDWESGDYLVDFKLNTSAVGDVWILYKVTVFPKP